MKSKQYLEIDPNTTPLPKVYGFLVGAIAPRPIAFASTVDKNGNPNLSPFSFFNTFGTNPPVFIFSPTRGGKLNNTKNTYDNIKEVPEVVINVVSYNMIQQVNLASTEFPKGVNEFLKAGFTMEKSALVKPYRVMESPVQFECKVTQVIETGYEGLAGNLVICEMLLMHIDQDILDETGKIDPDKIDLVGRMGANYYCRASGNALFEVKRPVDPPGIGIDSLPSYIRNSNILTGNDLGKLGDVKSLPTDEELNEIKRSAEITSIYESIHDLTGLQEAMHNLAKQKIAEGNVEMALKILLVNLDS